MEDIKIDSNNATWKNCDKFLWFLVIFMSSYGLLLIRSATREGREELFLSHLVCVLFGLCTSLILQFIDYRKLSRFWILISVFCSLLIIYTLIFGSTLHGAAGVKAKAWIKIPGGFSFQTSEIAKIGFVFSFAKHLSILKEYNKINSIKYLSIFLLHVMVPVILTHLQGDDGASIIFILIAIFEMFIAGVSIKFFMFGITLLALSIPIMWNFVLAPYQKNRILNMFNPDADPYRAGYQIIQARISIGSGGFLGTGIFNGKRAAEGIVPVHESDFIFTVAGEELGFVGCFLIILFLSTSIFRISYIAKHARDYLGLFSCFGFLGLILSQCIFNLGMCLSFLPVAGIVLPFFSSGGSSIICLFLGVALMQSIYMLREDDSPKPKRIKEKTPKQI